MFQGVFLMYHILVYDGLGWTMFTLQTSFKPLLLKGRAGGGGGGAAPAPPPAPPPPRARAPPGYELCPVLFSAPVI